MRNYDRVHPRKPEGIEERKAYIVGVGIAGLSAAAFLVRDAQMPGKNITVYDQLPVFGGSMDAAGSAANGYVSRGERELEPYMECLWDLFGSIPSLYEEGRTVQDETRECNKNWEIDSKHRLWEQGYEIVEGQKASRGAESHAHGLAARAFYSLISRATGIDMANASDFKLLDRKVVDVLNSLPERNTFFRALSSWIGLSLIHI